MNAAEARKTADSKNQSDPSVSGIILLIKLESMRGVYELWCPHVINKGARNALEELGYKVAATTYDRNDPVTKISW